MTEPVIEAYLEGEQYLVTAVSGSAVTVSGDAADKILPGAPVRIGGSTGNDGVYTVVSAVYDGGHTEITLNAALPDTTADGSLYALGKIPDKVQSGALLNIYFAITGADTAEAVIDGSYAVADPDTLALGASGGTYAGMLSVKTPYRDGKVYFTVTAESGADTSSRNFYIKVLPVNQTASFAVRAARQGLKGLKGARR